MPGLLYLHGGAELAGTTFLSEGRGCWSHALPLVLEKYGYLAVEVRGPEALGERELWSRYDCALIGRLPDGTLTPELATRLIESGIPALVEAPVPPALLTALGIRRAKPAKPELSVEVIDASLASAAKDFGFVPGGRLGPARDKPIARNGGLDWQALPAVPIDERQADAWRRPGWDAQIFVGAPKGRVLAEWFRGQSGPRHPAVIERGSLTVCSFGLLTALGQAHTSQPAVEAAWPASVTVTGLETLLLALVDRMHRRAGAVRARVLPWPAGRSWALSVRHDFDRPLGPDRVSAVVRRHAQIGTHATWYWRARHVTGEIRDSASGEQVDGSAAVRIVASAKGHEVALHTEMLWAGAESEQAGIEATIHQRLMGTSAHGDPDCFRYQGAPNVLWAEARGMLYTELLQHPHWHPHRFATLEPDGRIRPLEVICLPRHESFDRSVKEGETHAQQVRTAPERWQRLGGLLQVLSHPDVHSDELFEVLASLPHDRRADLTAAEAADWWRRTHTLEALRVRALGAGRFRLTAREPADGLVVELLGPEGRRTHRVLDLRAGEPIDVHADGAP